jgi:hypothetical protein
MGSQTKLRNCSVVGGDIVNGDIGDAEHDLSAVGQPPGDEVCEHLVLGVDGDRRPAGQ